MTTYVRTLVVGAGQAGLALSHHLVARGHDHVLLERGRVAERWRSERWDSFRLLTPNWQTRLPGWSYLGPEPHGFMGREEVVRFFDGYARSFSPPVREGVSVLSVHPDGRGTWTVRTDAGVYRCHDVVLATGNYDVPHVPGLATELPAGVHQLHTSAYRSPRRLPPGGVLVVGAGPSGQQIAREIARAGRPVWIAVGHHRPLPRRYRGRDCYDWLDLMGLLDRTVDDLTRRVGGARQQAPSVVVAGGDEALDLHGLAADGVVPTGRLVGASGGAVEFADDLPARVAEADANVARLRAGVDTYVSAHGLDVPAEPPAPTRAAAWADRAPRRLDLRAHGVTTVVWATGYRRDFSWVHAPVLDPRGEVVQRRGSTAMPGLHVLGLRWLWTRRSNFIDGVGRDAEFLATRIAGAPRRRAA